MKAKIYDKNYKLIKKDGTLKGIYKENHFVYQTGENFIYHIPLLGKLIGILPVVGPLIRPHEVRIMCNFEEVLDDNDDYLVEYRKLGDRYEQIPIRHESPENQVNIGQALKEVELAQARFDANVKQPDPTNMMAIAFPIIAILLLAGIYFSGQNSYKEMQLAASSMNVSQHMAQGYMPAAINATLNNTRVTWALYQFLRGTPTQLSQTQQSPP